MAITDELREWAKPFHDVWYDYKSDTYTFTTDGDGQPTMDSIRADTYILRIADRIDAEHEADVSTACRLAAGLDDDALAKRGYIALPVDADGVPIRVGDRLTDGEYTFTVCELATFRDGSWSIRNEDGNAWAACDVTHHALTVEDVLREFAEKITDSQIPGVHPTYEEAIAEYAAKLRLAEGVE